MNEMSEELATVVAIEGDHAWVECERRSACSGCQQQSGCGTGTVAKAFPLKAPRLRVRLTAEVSVGQQIRLGIPQESLLRGAALVYVLPLFCLLAGALLGQLWLAPLLSGGEGITILCCLLGGVLGFLLVRYFSNRLDQGRYGPQMLGVVVPVRILP
ncbi:Protein RseC [Aeromonas veronii]